jgi:hypothetical protein
MPWEAMRESMLTVFSQAQSFTLEPKLKVSSEAALIAPALSRPYAPKDKTVYSAVANALSLLIGCIVPGQNDAPLPKFKTNCAFDPRDRSTWAGARR